MPTNIYVAAYPFHRREAIDETLAGLAQSLSGYPLSYLQFYSIVILGEHTKLSAYDLQRKTLDAIETTNAQVDVGYRELRHLIKYQGEFHGVVAPDGRQIYMFGMQRPEVPSLREKASLELVTVGDILMDTVLEFSEYHSGLTLWRFDFPSRQTAEEKLKIAEERLRGGGLQVVSSMADVVL
ncbi:MAG: hypothetical protein HY361_00950 [Candidatus Aenigmarchaeota archaeon]|nr:hypothetical protein [Candidatus Aenigmarchaeota archaeon]